MPHTQGGAEGLGRELVRKAKGAETSWLLAVWNQYSYVYWPVLERLRTGFTPTCNRPGMQGPGYQPGRAFHTLVVAVELRQLVGGLDQELDTWVCQRQVHLKNIKKPHTI